MLLQILNKMRVLGETRGNTTDSPEVQGLKCAAARQKVASQFVAEKSSARAAAIHALGVAKAGCAASCTCSQTVSACNQKETKDEEKRES